MITIIQSLGLLLSETLRRIIITNDHSCHYQMNSFIEKISPK